MRYVHICGAHRKDGNNGGVCKFAWYLEKAIGCELLTDNEYTGWDDGNTVFIVDGDHGKNIPEGTPVISVAHGTWAALHRRWLKPDINDHTEKSQIARWQRPNVKVVSVSPGVTWELQNYCNVEPAAEIWHGIDHELFTPSCRLPNQKPVVIYASKSPGKGYDNIPALQELLRDKFEVRYLDADIGKEHLKFQDGDIFLHMSLSDGNSYACLEAMSCNLPCVVTNVGMFYHFDDSEIGRVLPYTASVADYAEAVEDVWARCNTILPRRWVLRHATFAQFKQNWEKFLYENSPTD